MRPTITYYYWLLSDWAYFGAQRLEKLARTYDARVDHYPIRLPDVYAVTGGIELHRRAPQRQLYRIAELKRWRERLGMPLNLNPVYFSADIDLASRMVYAVKRQGGDPGELSFALLRAVWAEDRDLGNTDTLIRIASSVGYDGEALVDAARQPEPGEDYEAATRQAPQDGVFGSPFYLLNGEPFWGQDRLDFLEEQLAGQPQPDGPASPRITPPPQCPGK